MIWIDVQKLCDNFLDEWPMAEYGPAHITLADGNFEDGHLLYCIKETFKAIRKDKENNELWETFAFLMMLVDIPENERLEPEDEAEEMEIRNQWCDPS
jgi:hypothetical protein